MICSYPAAEPAWSSAEVEADMDAVNSVVAKTRSLRSGVHDGTLPCLRRKIPLPANSLQYTFSAAGQYWLDIPQHVKSAECAAEA